MATIELKKHERDIELTVEKQIEDISVQKRCYIAELVKKALTKFFDEDDIKVKNSYSLYNLPIINEELNIIDFEINSLSVHVIPTVDKSKNVNVYIPRIYKQYNYKPDIVLFVNFSKTLTKMDILGFATDIDLSNLAIPKMYLKNPDTLVDTIKSISPQNSKISDNTINTTKELMLAFIENSLSEEGKLFFFKNLINSKTIRKNYKLFYALNCDFISIAEEKANTIEELPSATITNDTIVTVPEPLAYEENIDSTYATETPAESISTNDVIPEEFIEEDIFTEDTLEDLDEDILNDYSQEEILDSAELYETPVEEEPIINIAESMPIVDIAENTAIAEPIQIIEQPSANIEEPIPVLDITESVPANTELDILPIENDNGFSLDNDTEEVFDLSENTSEEIALNPLEESIDIPTISQLSEPELNQPTAEMQSTQEDTQIQPTAVENTIEENPLISPIINAEQPVEEIKTENTGDDIFDFLSNMAEPKQEEPQQATVDTLEEVIQPIEEPVQPIEEASIPQVVPTQEETIAFAEGETTQSEDVSSTVSDLDMALNSNLDTTSQEVVEDTTLQQAQQAVQSVNTTKKLPLIPALLVVALLAAGYGLYMNKDAISSHFNKNDSIQGITEEADDAALPPPIDSTALPDNTANNGDSTGANVPPPPTSQSAVETSQTTEQLPSLPNTVETPKPKNLNDAIATALSKDYTGVRISKVSWEVSETLASNPSVSRYLSIAGKSIKNSLSQDLTAATEPSFKDNVAVSITYKKDGSVVKAEMATSSGSKQIDDIIIKSVKDTLGFIRMPALNLNKPEYQVKLMIRL